MVLTEEECWERLRAAETAVLATVHRDRGVDLVPVVFVVDDRRVLMPIDAVKAKSTLQLKRLANIAADPRIGLLVDHYDDDWSQLWWVRVHGSATEAPVTDAWASALSDKYPAYRAEGAIASVMVLDVRTVSGWAA